MRIREMKLENEMTLYIKICACGLAVTMLLTAPTAKASSMEEGEVHLSGVNGDIVASIARSCPPGYRTCGSGCCPT